MAHGRGPLARGGEHEVEVAGGRWGIRVASAALAVAFAGPAMAAPEPQQGTDDPPSEVPAGEPTEVPTEAVAEVELAALSAARDVVAQRMVAAAGAEGARRRAEERVVAAHRLVADAEEDHAHVTSLVEAGRRELVTARRLQRHAQDVFDLNVATSYKFGGAQSTALFLAALQSASDAHDLARAVRELDGVLGHSYDELGRRIRSTVLAEQRLATLERLEAVAARAVTEAEVGVAPVEEAAHQARAGAHAQEAALLDAAARALQAEQAAVEAGALPEDLAAGARSDPLAPGTAPVEGESGPSIEQRASWLANRVSVLRGQASLPAEAWALRRDLTCPVVDGTFGNDFHFPRSHGRRHLGTDVFAPTGTPIVALADGEITAIDGSDAFDGESDLGGITVELTTEVGRFYAAHLDGVADGLQVGQRVEAGDTLGYVGDTGNARGGAPHLHLGWYVDDVAINPWPSLEFVCHPDATT